MNQPPDPFKFRARKCHECGKVFHANGQWAYKRSTSHKTKTVSKFFCSWHCLQADYRRTEQAKQSRKKRPQELTEGGHQRKYGAVADQIREMLLAGKTDEEIMEALNLDTRKPIQAFKGVLTREKHQQERIEELKSLINATA